MTKRAEEVTVAHEDLGARKGVLVTFRVNETDGSVSYRIDRQWNRGKSKESLMSVDTVEEALCFTKGVVAGVKLANA